MIKKSTVVAGLMAAAVMGFGALPASAAPLAPNGKALMQSLSGDGLVQEVQHRRRFSRCRAWRRECSFRWGFGSFRYNRCMLFHGCL